MTKLLAIARRDIGSAFASPIAWLVMCFFAFVIGLMFVYMLGDYQYWSQQLMAQAFGSPDMDQVMSQLNVLDMVIAPLFANSTFFFLLLIPAVTMRLFSEERKSGTDELLLTAPLTVTQIVAGKFLAALTLVLAIIAMTLLPVGSLFVYGNPPIKAVASAYLGLVLLGAAFAAVGLLASALSENQIVAAVLAESALLFFYVIGWGGAQAGEATVLGRLLTYLSITTHFEDFTMGVIDSVHVIYYVSFTFLALFLTARVVESRRWR